MENTSNSPPPSFLFQYISYYFDLYLNIQCRMQAEYSKLSKRLTIFYLVRVGIAFFIIIALFFWLNPLPFSHSQIQNDPSIEISINRLQMQVQGSIAVMRMISKLVGVGITTPVDNTTTPPTSSYCTSNQSSCQQLQQLPDAYLSSCYFQTSNSMTCMSDCSSIAAFADTFWLFKIRQPLIQYIIIQYKQINTTSLVFVPALAQQKDDVIQHTLNNKNGLFQIDGGGFIYGEEDENVSVWIKMNSTFIQAQCNIPISSISVGEGTASNQTDRQTVTVYLPSIPQMIVTMQVNYTDLDSTYILICIVFALIAILIKMWFIVKCFVDNWAQANFNRLLTIDHLYRFQINQMFSGRKPVNSLVLQQASIYEFYEHLSQMPNKQFSELHTFVKPPQRLQSFKFQPTIKGIITKYHTYIKPIFIQKNRQIINNKFFIQSSVNQIIEASAKKLKQLQLKARQLKLTAAFFKYSYLSILLQMNQFDQMLANDSYPLPDAMVTALRYINRAVKSVEIKNAFRIAQNLRNQTQEELQMRIQDSLLQKYLQTMKDMDVHGINAKQLGLEKQLIYLNDNIENMRFLLTQHNKNIRLFSKAPS